VRVRPLALACFALIASAGNAGDLVTSPLWVNIGDVAVCAIQNTGRRALRDLTIELRDPGGTLHLAGPIATVAPGDGSSVSIPAVSSSAKVCRFAFRGGTRRAVASACVLGPGGSCQAIISAQPH
jgi:hypothetical protein